MSKILSRRSTLKILASAMTITPFYASANKNLYSYTWQSSALGSQVDMQIFTKNKNHLERLITLINSEINRFNKIFYLQDASSQINLLNKHKVLIKPDIELLDAINLSEKLYLLSNGSFDITIQPLWNSYSSGQQVNTDGIGFNNIDITSKKISLLNKNTEITINSLAQGILTDRIHNILLNSGIKSHLINFGEGRSSGINPLIKKWQLNVNGEYIDITNKAFSVSESKSTLLPNNKSHLFNAKTYDAALNIPNKTTVIARNATLADGLSTAYAVSDELTRKHLVKVFPKEKFIIT
jgi:thiamine biosynthesis lipoprotein